MYKLLKTRRSIRKYKSQKVEPEKVDLLIRSILRSPSGRGINPWEIIAIDNEELVYQLAGAKAHGAKFLEGLKQCLVILADPNKTDVWIEDASVAMTIGHLAAADMGLGSCWIQIRRRKTSDGMDSEAYVKELLGIPETMRVEAILAYGYADEEKAGHPETSLQWEKVHHNQYGKK